MAVPVMDQAATPGTEAFSPAKPKSVEVDAGDKDEVDVANKAGEVDCEGNANVKTPEESKMRRVPRPFLEIETGEEDGSVSQMTSPDCDTRRSDRVSLALTPLSCKSTDSSAEYHHPDQTIIILDWDDTICPSTTCMRQHGLSVTGPRPAGELARRLQVLAFEAQQLLEVAATLADKVVVVTNAEEGWVNLSCRAWLPDLLDTLEKCEVASARSQFEPTGISSPAGWKARAFEEVIEHFYQRYPNQSWKNIISIGDAPHEREALARVVRMAPIFRGKRCRSKSIKFVLRPSIEQLARELHMLRDSLRDIVLHDDDLDMHFCTETFADPLLC